ncbi:hypothetical protein TPR58_20180 [Sphingomonas sp. HF-S3]|uniref:Uncharacterized protein n=1 Tax=Sphingomonas rustica TaxID=3103142 RepID=A0ABV0BD81_9SPHN
MQPTLTLCRTQEAYQRTLAAAATLENVRSKANAAATAWAKEGAAALLRETRKTRQILIVEQDDGDDGMRASDVRALSENPDRGFVTA